jgi:hypothetical protein
MIKSAEAHLAERNFDATLPTRVLWSNFPRMGCTKSVDSSIMGLVAEDYADYVSNLQTLTIMVPLTPESEGNFSFRHVDMNELISATNSITPTRWVRMVFPSNSLN